jgi:hypothetical protein
MRKINILLLCCLNIVFACSNKTIGTSTSSKVVKRTVNVFTASQLAAALQDAKQGDDIVLADGIYYGKFVIDASASGTATNNITLRGSRNAILDGGGISTGYVLYLQASFWNIKGITLRNGLKGLMMDGANNNSIDSIKVTNIGEEGIHFRKFSCHNILQNAVVNNTGLKTPDYGEGVYIGSAVSNWAKHSNGVEDRCDSNIIINNTIGPNCTAECIDVKEGTTGGIIKGNSFNSTGITGANSGDSWMDVKGNNYTIENNTGFNPAGSVLKDGYQVHCAVNGWGCNNIFSNNNSTVNADGYAINVVLQSSKGQATGNKVLTNNKAVGASKGISNIELSKE